MGRVLFTILAVSAAIFPWIAFQKHDFQKSASCELIDHIVSNVYVAYQRDVSQFNATRDEEITEGAFPLLEDQYSLKPVIEELLYRESENAEYALGEWRSPNSPKGILYAILFSPYFDQAYFHAFGNGKVNPSYEVCQKALASRLFKDIEFRNQYRDFVIWSQLFLPTMDMHGVDKAVFANEVANTVIQLSELDRPLTWQETSYVCTFAVCINYEPFFKDENSQIEIKLNLDQLVEHIATRVYSFDPVSGHWKSKEVVRAESRDKFTAVFEHGMRDVSPSIVFASKELDAYFRQYLRELSETPPLSKGSGLFDQRGQASLMSFLGKRTRFRPRGRIVDSRLRRRAMDSTHPSSPSGLPRWADSRTAANSASDRGVLTRSTHPVRRGSGHGDSNGGLGSGLRSQRQSEPHRHCSARSTNPARRAFRSTYRQTIKK